MEYRKIEDLKKLNKNPRTIKKKDLEILIKSIKDNKDYFEARPIILSDRTGELVIIGGNQRYDAAIKLGLKEVPTHLLKNLTKKREDEIIIRDNVNNGDWLMEKLIGDDWDLKELSDWGVEFSKDIDEKVEKSKIDDIGELEFSDDLFLEHNYLILYFDNEFDWSVAQDKFGLKKVKSCARTDKSIKVGTSRVLKGSDIIKRIK